jgi:cobalt/nickel transport system ATP-binding protein
MDAGREDLKISVIAQNLEVAYPDGTIALNGVNIKIPEGRFYGLLGMNGSGKTTLLKALAGLFPKYKGSIQVESREIKDYPARELYQRLGMVFHDPNLQLLSSTVFEEVALGPNNLGLSHEEVKKRAWQSLADVDMEALAEKCIQKISYGQKKRICVASMLTMGQRILFLDEPTEGLDPKGEKKIMGLLRKLNKEKGITIMMATHHVELVAQYCDSVCLLHKGKVKREGRPLEVFSDAPLMESLGLRVPFTFNIHGE